MEEPVAVGRPRHRHAAEDHETSDGEAATLYRLTDKLYRAQSLPEIFEAALDAIVESLGDRGSVLLFDEDGVMRFVAWRGLSETYRAKLEGHSPWTPEDVDPEPILVGDIDETAEPDWVKAAVKAEGIRALAFIPLLDRGRVVGKFMSYRASPHAFPENEVNLAITIARQIGFGLERAGAEKARRLAEEELRESEHRFRLMSEQAPVMIWISDASGRCLHLNRLLRDFWGVDERDLKDFDWQTSMHPEDAARIGEAMLSGISGQKPVIVEGRYRDAAGQYRVLRTDARPRFSAGGEFLGMLGVNVDVTESRESEKALRESEERLRIALEAGRMGTWRYDLETGEQTWGAGQFELFGLDPEKVRPTRKLFLSLVHPEDLELVEFGMDDVRPEGIFLDSEFRIVRPDGQIRWITAHALARHDGQGRAVEVIGVNQDITERKRSEEALRHSEERLREFGDASSDVLWICDAERLQWEYLSPAYSKIYGISRENALQGDTVYQWMETIDPEDRDHARRNIERIRSGERLAFEFRIRRPADGQIRWVRTTGFPMPDQGGLVHRLGGTSQDITREKAAAEQLQVLVAELQHRARNLLAVVQSLAGQSLANSASLDVFAEKFNRRLSALSRVQGLLSSAERDSVALGSLIRMELEALGGETGSAVETSGPEIFLHSSVIQTLALATHELATNARKYGALSRPDGRLSITWQRTRSNGSEDVEIEWRETIPGANLSSGGPKAGYGRMLIERALPYALAAKTSYDVLPEGVRCCISVPLGRLVRNEVAK